MKRKADEGRVKEEGNRRDGKRDCERNTEGEQEREKGEDGQRERKGQRMGEEGSKGDKVRGRKRHKGRWRQTKRERRGRGGPCVRLDIVCNITFISISCVE